MKSPNAKCHWSAPSVQSSVLTPCKRETSQVPGPLEISPLFPLERQQIKSLVRSLPHLIFCGSVKSQITMSEWRLKISFMEGCWPLVSAQIRKGNSDLSVNFLFPGGSEVKNLPANAGYPGLIPGSGRSPGEGNGKPLQYCCLGNPMDRGAWRATAHGVTKSQTGLSDWASTLHVLISHSYQDLPTPFPVS